MKLSNTPANPELVKSTVRLRTLLLSAAILHAATTSIVLLIGRLGLMPSQFDRNGLAAFADDGSMYQGEVIELCDVLKHQGLIAWATWPTQLHVRLYSVPVAVLGGRSNLNILTIEPLNLIYYLAIVVLVFTLGKVIFNSRTGLIAAVTVALWPSLLLHTTQLLRDPLLIASLLVLVLSLILVMQRDYAWWRAVLIGAAGSVAIVLIRIVRLPMWNILWPTIVLGLFFLGARVVRQRRFPAGNIAGIILILATMIITPYFQDSFRNQEMVRRPRIIVPEEVQSLPMEQQIAARRHGFSLQLDPSGQPVPSEAGSDIDPGVRLTSTTDIIRHVPRALMVGFLAPFPNMWFSSGKQVGASGRLLSGFETLLSYMIECLALYGLWRERRNLSAWFIFLVVTLGAVALGLVVANIGALYRLRYPFWVLLIICGASGASHLFQHHFKAANAGNSFASKEPPGTLQS
jgi:hypothetical protein